MGRATSKPGEDSGATDSLDGLRAEIDRLDEQIVRLLHERASAALRIGQLKAHGESPTEPGGPGGWSSPPEEKTIPLPGEGAPEGPKPASLAARAGPSGRGWGSPVLVPEREAEVLQHVRSVEGTLSPDAVAAVYREVLSTSRALQRPLRIAHLGPAGTFGHQAARECFGSAVELESCATNPEILSAVEKGAADYGLVPFENSTEGPVNEVLDRLVDTPLQVCAEVTVPVAHALMARSGLLADVRQVLSHPQALGQCRDWLARHLPGVPVEPATSTARAAELAAEAPGTAAIAPRLAAEVYGLNVLAENIQDLAGNVTRFLVLARPGGVPARGPTGQVRTDAPRSPCRAVSAQSPCRTALVFSIRDRVGALRDLTDAFAANRVNLSSIQSRPSRRRAWDYVFFVELEGHLSEPRVKKALRQAEQHTVFFKVLGSWPVSANGLVR